VAPSPACSPDTSRASRHTTPCMHSIHTAANTGGGGPPTHPPGLQQGVAATGTQTHLCDGGFALYGDQLGAAYF
jgi:hypothetical protein